MTEKFSWLGPEKNEQYPEYKQPFESELWEQLAGGFSGLASLFPEYREYIGQVHVEARQLDYDDALDVLLDTAIRVQAWRGEKERQDAKEAIVESKEEKG